MSKRYVRREEAALCEAKHMTEESGRKLPVEAGTAETDTAGIRAAETEAAGIRTAETDATGTGAVEPGAGSSAQKNCLLCGVGGQGVVLASRLIAFAAMEQGHFVRTTETIGMAQRGGSVVSHVRIGREIHSPLIPLGTADVILAFEPGEAVRCLPYLKEGGLVIADTRIVKPVTASIGGTDYNSREMTEYLEKKAGRLLLIDGEDICRRAGSPKVLNVALLGAAAQTGALDISPEEMLDAVRKNVKPRFMEWNERALQLGREAGGMMK